MRDVSPSPLDITYMVLPSNVCTPRKSRVSVPAMCADSHLCLWIAPTTGSQSSPQAIASRTTEIAWPVTLSGFCLSYFFEVGAVFVDITVRASGCFGLQSSGGKATRQNVGHATENSNPISAFPERTGPRKTT